MTDPLPAPDPVPEPLPIPDQGSPGGLLPPGVGSPADLAAALATGGYLADAGLATAAYLALRLPRPLFLEGDAGVGKTAIAHALAVLLGAPLIRLQCYEGIDASQALYDWDFPRQLLHLRAVEALHGTEGGEATSADGAALAAVEAELFDRRFLVPRPLLQALETSPSVLLVDEIDRADDEFEAFLLEVLSDFTVSIPEMGTVRAEVPPVVVVTSNRTREVHDALKRRCYYHWIDHPDFAREVQIVLRRQPEASRQLAEQVVAVVQHLRTRDFYKAPGVSETLDWTQALVALGADHLDADLATATLGAVLKYREDTERASRLDVGKLLHQALGA
jgi:MoxR-like ATPase